MIQEIEKAFKTFYPGKRLLAAKINDMHFSVWYDDGEGSGKGDDGVTQDSYEFWTHNFDGNMNQMREVIGVGAYTYWHTCWTHTWIQPQDR